MPRIESYLRSFSFRTGALIFLTVSALLIGQRILVYQSTLAAAREDIQLIIDAHEQDMDEAVDQYGISYIRDQLQNMSKNMPDRHLYFLLNQKGKLTGNLAAWPHVRLSENTYTDASLTPKNEAAPVHMLVSLSDYGHGNVLLIGYALERVDVLREKFLPMIADNIILSLAVSLLLGVFIVWLLSRHLRSFNIACNRIIAGNLDYRISTRDRADEFGRLAANINRMLEWIKSLVKTFQDSSNALAHDMRTPLSQLRLSMRALSERPRLETLVRQEIAGLIERLDGIIDMFDHILNIAKAESRAGMELFTVFDIRQLAQDVTDLYAPAIEDRNLRLSANFPDQPVMIRGDRQLLGQAIANLIDNACKYTPPTGKISVALTETADCVILAVSDNGPGIPPEWHEKAKERFTRLDSSRHTEGHGLGLSLVVAVAGLHLGGLDLQDNGPGLRAVLTLKKSV